MTIARRRVLEAAKWILRVARARVQPAPGSPPGKGYATYTEFCDAFKLGEPHHNRIMDELLLAVMSECESQGWPDLAALVIHEQGTGQRDGPGDGWYVGHDYLPGHIPTWQKHCDECWKRAPSLVIP